MSQELNEMLLARREKLKALIDMGKNPYEIEKYNRTNFSADITENFEEYEGKTVSIAGRLMAKRGHGKVCFVDIQDSKGRIQSFLKLDNLGESYEEVKLLDLGDIVGIEGEVFKTQMGEISVRAYKFSILCKSLQILPEKFHGLTDIELRYRQRYVDLIVNPEIKETFLKRNKIIKGIREYLDDRGYLEVETPILSIIAGGGEARPFTTHHNTLDIDMNMRIANELYLKRLVVGGFDKVYEMGKMFRNEGMDQTHNPEFTSIEIYSAYEDYNDMMELTENLIAEVCKKVNGTTKITYNGKEIDLTPPFKRMTMVDAIKEYAKIDMDKVTTDEEAQKIAKEHNIELEAAKSTKGHIVQELFEKYCEEHLIQPTFIIKHPVEVSPLAKRDPKNKDYTQRFELFIDTNEFANAFSELNDPIDQRERFEKQVENRKKGNDEAHPMDEDFLNAIEVGLPPTGGLGIGVDRLVMLLTGNISIRDIILFPTMKPLSSQSTSEEEN